MPATYNDVILTASSRISKVRRLKPSRVAKTSPPPTCSHSRNYEACAFMEGKGLENIEISLSMANLLRFGVWRDLRDFSKSDLAQMEVEHNRLTAGFFNCPLVELQLCRGGKTKLGTTTEK